MDIVLLISVFRISVVSFLSKNLQKLDINYSFFPFRLDHFSILQARSTEYTQAKTGLQALLRKHGGSLAVRDLSDVVPRDKLVSTENITTLVVVVSKPSREEFLSNYEHMTEFVVPRSAVEVAEDKDYVAFMVVMFRRVVDEFKVAARSKSFQAKELAATALELLAAEGDGTSTVTATMAAVSHDGGSSACVTDNEATLARLRQDMELKRSALIQWCLASYGEAFSSWIHVTAIRLFVESILRYGLPPQFMPVLMRPGPKNQAALRKLLAANFGAVGGQHFTSEPGGGGGVGEDLFPYVSFTLNIEEHS
jgi:V-type H+-transporting ATPase subunit C